MSTGLTASLSDPKAASSFCDDESIAIFIIAKTARSYVSMRQGKPTGALLTLGLAHFAPRWAPQSSSFKHENSHCIQAEQAIRTLITMAKLHREDMPSEIIAINFTPTNRNNLEIHKS